MSDRKLTDSMLKRFDRTAPRYTSYPTALEFHDGVGAAHYRQALGALGKSGRAPAIYVHLPFCEQRCTYCACNVVQTRNHERASDPYLTRLTHEFEMAAAAIGAKLPAAELHLGGGTPTWHSPEELTRLVTALESCFDFSPNTPRAVEVDPRVTTAEHITTLAALGFRRFSLGVQDVDDRVQQAIGRVQPVECTRQVVEQVRAAGAQSVNFDLVYGLPLQTPTSFADTLQTIVELLPDRLAIYGFAYVPWAHKHQKEIDAATLPAPEVRLQLLEMARETLGAAGYVDIGMDHFARPTDELARAQARGELRRNFMGYTTTRSEDMLGFGLSAIGYVSGVYVQNAKKLRTYLDTLDAGEFPVERGFECTEDDQRRAWVIRELMCNFGVSKSAYAAQFQREFASDFAAELPVVSDFVQEGLLADSGEILSVTERGRPLIRVLAMTFDAHSRARADLAGVFSRVI